MDTELVLDSSYGNATPFLVVNKVGKSSCVRSSFLASCKHELDVCVSVGDETLNAVEHPHLLSLIPGSLEHNCLKVRSCIRLGEVHGASFSLVDSRKELGLDFLACKLCDSLCAVLKSPDVGIAGISSSDKLGSHNVRNHREVQTVILSWQGDSVNAGLGKSLLVLLCALGVGNSSVLAYWTVNVHLLGVRGNDISADLAHDIHNLVV